MKRGGALHSSSPHLDHRRPGDALGPLTVIPERPLSGGMERIRHLRSRGDAALRNTGHSVGKWRQYMGHTMPVHDSGRASRKQISGGHLEPIALRDMNGRAGIGLIYHDHGSVRRRGSDDVRDVEERNLKHNFSDDPFAGTQAAFWVELKGCARAVYLLRVRACRDIYESVPRGCVRTLSECKTDQEETERALRPHFCASAVGIQYRRIRSVTRQATMHPKQRPIRPKQRLARTLTWLFSAKIGDSLSSLIQVPDVTQ